MAQEKKGGWLNKNIDLLLQNKGKWIAFSESKGLIATNNELHDLMAKAKTITKKFVIWHVHEHFGSPRSLLIRMAKRNVYTIKDESHFWIPEIELVLKNGKHKLTQKMLIDSGSDFTIIPYQVGIELGFSVQPEELRKKAGVLVAVLHLLNVKLTAH